MCVDTINTPMSDSGASAKCHVSDVTHVVGQQSGRSGYSLSTVSPGLLDVHSNVDDLPGNKSYSSHLSVSSSAQHTALRLCAVDRSLDSTSKAKDSELQIAPVTDSGPHCYDLMDTSMSLKRKSFPFDLFCSINSICVLC